MTKKKTLFDYFNLSPKTKENTKNSSFSDNSDNYYSDLDLSSIRSGPVDNLKAKLLHLEEKSSFLNLAKKVKSYSLNLKNTHTKEIKDSDEISTLVIPESPFEENIIKTTNVSYETKSTYKNEDSTVTTTVNEKDKDRYKFLVDIRDKNKKRKGEDEYDPSSLYIPEKEYDKLKPFEKQFWDIKKHYFDTIIFFKKGKFYELYENDAEISAKLFDFKITDRVNMKMTGFPEASLDYWAKKFLENGFKLGIVEQSENMIGKQIREKDEKENKKPSSKEKLIRRELKEVITQGTIYNPEHLQTPMPVYLMSLAFDDLCYSKECEGKNHISIILYDASISEIYHTSFCDDEEFHKLKTIFGQYDVKEVISSKQIIGITNRIIPNESVVVSDKKYNFSNEREYTCYSYLHNYLKDLKRESALNVVQIKKLQDQNKCMVLDNITLKNLEIFKNSYDGTDKKTLFKTVNYCVTPLGQRMLKRWMIAPLLKADEILLRQSMASTVESCDLSTIQENLKCVGDTERLFGRLTNGNPGPKDFNNFIKSVDNGIVALKSVELELKKSGKDEKNFNTQIKDIRLQIEAILNKIKNSYKITDTEITPGEMTDDELCLLMKEQSANEEKLNVYLKMEKNKLKCHSLKFKDIGKEIFQIEAPKDLKLPPDYFIVSSTKGVNRFYTSDLRKLVNEYVEMDERIFQSKGSLLRRVIASLIPDTIIFHSFFSIISHIDCYTSFCIFALKNAAIKPEISDDLQLENMTNPIYPNFVPNNYNGDKKILVLTGPNMGGKSTLLRSICLNIILFQMGMKVCCSKMKTPIFDRIFTRIGASDNLLKGESTFMVELSETANILKHSTNNSFIVIDELGRGTSTKDGECIANAVLEYLKKIDCYVLFSTHYHKIVGKTDGVKNGYMASRVEKSKIIYLYKLTDGLSLDSHGLYVAKMAGVPGSIVERANEIRKTLQFKNKE